MKLKVGEKTKIGMWMYRRISKSEAAKIPLTTPIFEMESGGLTRPLARTEIKGTQCMILVRDSLSN